MLFRFVASYPDCITAIGSADRLASFVARTRGRDPVSLWLVNETDAAIWLTLPDAVIRAVTSWQGEAFTLPATVLKVEVNARDLEEAKATLQRRWSEVADGEIWHLPGGPDLAVKLPLTEVAKDSNWVKG